LGGFPMKFKRSSVAIWANDGNIAQLVVVGGHVNPET
jgi:hypothetical protein